MVSGPTCCLQVVDLDSRLLAVWRATEDISVFLLFFFCKTAWGHLINLNRELVVSLYLPKLNSGFGHGHSSTHRTSWINTRPASSSGWNIPSHPNLELFPLSSSRRPAWLRDIKMLCAMCWINFTFSCFSLLLLMWSCPMQLKAVLR